MNDFSNAKKKRTLIILLILNELAEFEKNLCEITNSSQLSQDNLIAVAEVISDLSLLMKENKGYLTINEQKQLYQSS